MRNAAAGSASGRSERPLLQCEECRISIGQAEQEGQHSGVEVTGESIDRDAFTARCERTGPKNVGAAHVRDAADILEAPAASRGRNPLDRHTSDGSALRRCPRLDRSAFNSRSAVTQKRTS